MGPNSNTSTSHKKPKRKILLKKRQPLGSLQHNSRSVKRVSEVIDLSGEDEQPSPRKVLRQESEQVDGPPLRQVYTPAGDREEEQLRNPRDRLTAVVEAVVARNYPTEVRVEGKGKGRAVEVKDVAGFDLSTVKTHTLANGSSVSTLRHHPSSAEQSALHYDHLERTHPHNPLHNPPSSSAEHTVPYYNRLERTLPPPLLSPITNIHCSHGLTKYQCIPSSFGALDLAREERKYAGDGFIDTLVANDMKGWMKKHMDGYWRRSWEAENEWPKERIWKGAE